MQIMTKQITCSRRKLSASHSGPDTHWMRGWVIPIADLDEVIEKLLPPPGIEAQSSSL
jgi:hypothetical protein